MNCLKIDALGKTSEYSIARRDLSQNFGLHPRDLRPIFSLRQMPTINRRGKCLIINFRSIKLIVATDQVLVFNTESEKIAEVFIPHIQDRIITREEKTKFEHVILEVALGYMLDKTRSNFAKVQTIAERILVLLRTQQHDEIFESLLAAKKRLSKLSKNTRELTEILDEILDDDEEMSELYLGRAPKNIDEVESILENAMEQLEDIANRIEELDENIDDTQEIITLKMSSRRNQIIKIDLLLTSVTAIFSLLAVVVGLFGMNIRNSLEKSLPAFWVVAGALVIFAISSGLFLWRWMRNKKIV